MTERDPAKSATIEGLTLSPSLDFVVEASQIPPQQSVIDRRVLFLCLITLGLGIFAGFVAQILLGTIALITNIAYYHDFSFIDRAPGHAVDGLGLWSIPIPVIGALVIGFMARYGSKAIRGHGIPEAMEQVLTNESRIPARVMFLKPISSAISIGTGGPFGAEGPIIATGGAIGSVVGQFIRTSAVERKTLLAAGAAGGMAATFGSPVSAVLLAIELLLFEFRPRSIIPVSLAACAATGIRMLFEGMEPVFHMPSIEQPSGASLASYIILGGSIGLISILVTKAVYAIEDTFEKIPIHWMWWPSIGATVVGLIGYFVPDTLGVGYYNISALLKGDLGVSVILLLCTAKFLSWSIALGSGTSGGTLAPLFTIGGGLGAFMGAIVSSSIPWLGVDPRIMALVGMAAIFSGASRAMLTSAIFAFETTLQPFGLLPLLGGCAASYLMSALLMRNSIMTEKIARRGIRTPEEYVADALEQVLVREVASQNVITLIDSQTIGEVRDWMAEVSESTSHQGFPVIDENGVLVGVVTRRNILETTISPTVTVSQILASPVRYIYDDCTVRQAADHMLNHSIGRLPVMSREKPHRLAGIVTRSDILSVFQRRAQESVLQSPIVKWFDRERFSSNATKSENSGSIAKDT